MTRETLLLVQKCAHTFSFYDLASGRAEKHIVLPNFPHEFVVDPVRKLAYVGHYGIETASHLGEMGGHSVFVIDLELREHVNTLNLWPFYRPHGLAVDGQGRLFVMSEAHNTLLRFSDPLASQVPDLAVPSGGYKTHLFALTRDAQTAYALNLLSNTVTKIKPNDPSFKPVAVMPGPTPEGNVLSSDESLLYVANRGDDTIVAIDTASMKVVGSGKTRRDPNRVTRFGRAKPVGVRHRPEGAALRGAAGQSPGPVVPSDRAGGLHLVPGSDGTAPEPRQFHLRAGDRDPA
jgi:YVTN family beta-propeller protein